jgi:hypothetical protein
MNNGSITGLALECLTNKTITMKNDWIQRGDCNLLWLPHEYRSDYSAFYGDTLAIGRRSGQVSFIEFDHS